MYRNFGKDGDPVAVPIELRPSTEIHRQPWFMPHPDDAVKILTIARVLISDGHWCQGHMATDQNDVAVFELNDQAFHYCAVAAIRRANEFLPAPRFFSEFWREQRYQQALQIMCQSIISKAIADNSHECSVMTWNDHANYADVLLGFNRAILIAPYAEVL